jgi:2',3'-cyclic-nucleotide 2'-phosphodiesterase (5'-nucleotidase family)
MAFQLQILHASDFEAGIPALDDAVNFSTVTNALRDDFANTVLLTSGDNYLPGPFFSAGSDPVLNAVPSVGVPAPGRADIAILNEIGFQASAFGNHEFDLGTNTVADVINTATASGRTYPGAQFPYLSSNLNFQPDAVLRNLVVPDGQAPRPRSIASSVVLTVNGERIGIVGATTPTLPTISSPGLVAVTPQPFAGNPTPPQLDALAAIIQTSVDALVATGINKVILLAHMQQIAIEQALATRLRNVDVIIAGGSNTRLVDSNDRLRPGDTAQGAYPFLTTSASGQPIAVVNTDGNFKYLGRFVPTFDDNGVIITSSLDATINGAYATDPASVAALIATNRAAGNVTATPDPEVVQITNALRTTIVSKDSNIFGNSPVFLNGIRNDVRTQETNLGNVTADANLFVARQTDRTTVLSLKNGGGIRDNIGEVSAASGSTDPSAILRLPTPANPLANKQSGQISQLDIENSLRFNNTLSLVTVTATQLKAVLEHGVSATATGATPGQFPQVGGVSFSFDATRQARNATNAGDRVRSIAVIDDNGVATDIVVRDGQIVGDPNRTFRMVTLNFLAGGGDNYPFPTFPNLNRVDLVQAGTRTGTARFADNGTEQDAFAEYLASLGSFSQPDTAPASDTRIQNLASRRDTVLPQTATNGQRQTFNITPTSGAVTIDNFGGVGTGNTAGNDVDTLSFSGTGLTLQNINITQVNTNVIITFQGVSGLQVALRNFNIQNLNNLDGIGNLLFSGQTRFQRFKFLSNTGENFEVDGDDDDDDDDNDDDAIFGGRGNDTIVSRRGNDILRGGAGGDVLNAGRGDDTCYGDDDNDVINGGRGNDTLFGGRGNDMVNGGRGNDICNGDDGDDMLNGNSGDDILNGGAGNDTFFGGRGNDTMRGGLGNDRMNGGRGADIFVIARNEGLDFITDFSQRKGDRIGLSGGLTFANLTFTQGSGGNSLIGVRGTTEVVAVVLGIQATSFTADFFTTV